MPKTHTLANYSSSPFFINDTALICRLDADNTYIQATLTIVASSNQALCLDGVALKLLSIAINDITLGVNEYQLTDSHLSIPHTTWKRFGQAFQLTTEVCIHPRCNTQLMGLYVSDQLLCTQCEPEGFRRITYYLDRPDIMSRFRVTLIADKTRYPVLLTNGNQIDTQDLTNNKHMVCFVDPHKKPSYLFALVAGALVHIKKNLTTPSGKQTAVYVHAVANNIHKLDFASEVILRAMTWDEHTYGCVYDLDNFHLVAVDDFNSGAMENKGLNIFNAEALLAHPNTTTDWQYMRIEAIIAHEYFHNWSGNRVTCRDWFQLSLKEGLTVFREAHYIADTYSPGLRRIDDVVFLRTHQFAEDASGLAHPVRPPSYQEIENFYTATVYEKGAEVLSMLCHLVGKAHFNQGCRHYFANHDGQAATIEDFILSIATVSKQSLDNFIRWYQQAGTPHVDVTVEYHASSQTLIMRTEQSCRSTSSSPNPKPYLIPMTFEVLDETGKSQRRGCVTIQNVRDTFCFNAITSRPVVSVFNNFSAPVTWRVAQLIDNNTAHSLIAAHATDLFTQWDSSRRLLQTAIVTQEVELVLPCFTAWFTLANANFDDTAVLSYFFALPSIDELRSHYADQDIITLCNKRAALMEKIARHKITDWEALYQTNRARLRQKTTTHQKTCISARALQNSALEYLMATGSDSASQLAYNQYNEASNMTERHAAIRLLIDHNHPQVTALLDDFYAQFSDDNTVITQWFRLQASSRHATTKTLETLFHHSKFRWTSPNLVRATLGAYLTNLEALHASSSYPENYYYAATKIGYLDGINNKVAARIATTLTKWQGLDEARTHAMQVALKSILPQASKGLTEVITKSLST